MTIDLTKLDDLIRRAEDSEEAPGGETHRLLRAASNLFDIPRVHSFVNCNADDQAALHLMREALPDWKWEIHSAGEVFLYPPHHMRHLGPAYGFSPDDLACSMFTATLKARKAMVEG